MPDSGEEEEQGFWQSGQSEATTAAAGHKRMLSAHLPQFAVAVFFWGGVRESFAACDML